MSTLYKHQREALERAKMGNLALFHECGTGKTLTALHIISYWKNQYENDVECRMKNGECRIAGTPAAGLSKTDSSLRFGMTGSGKGWTGALVVCPLSIIQSAWIADCRKFTPNLSIVSLWDKSPAGRKKQLEKKADIYVINFETFKSMFAAIQEKRFSVVIVDESSKMKAYDSQTTKALLALAGVWSAGKGVKFPVKHVAPHRYVLSGTPAPNSRMEYWGQLTFIAPNAAFSDNFYSFRGRYFVPRPLGRTGINLWDYTKDPRLQEEFNRRMAPLCHVVRKADAIDLPAMVSEIRKVKLSNPERKAYDTFRKDLSLKFGCQEVLASSAVVEIMKARQLTSGFCYANNKVFNIGSGKIEELLDLLAEIGTKQQTIIWCCFVQEIESIVKAVPGAAALYGGTADKDQIIKQFQSGQIRTLVANPQSAGHGLTFVNCSYAIYFSMDYSWEMNKQSQDRIHRIGQNSKCTCYYLLAENTIDEVIFDAVQNKKKLSEEILKYLRNENPKS
jgi:SNF2 family DNA or RNA helicase